MQGNLNTMSQPQKYKSTDVHKRQKYISIGGAFHSIMSLLRIGLLQFFLEYRILHMYAL